MPSKTCSFRLPDEIIAALEVCSAETGMSRTSIVVEALAKRLNLPVPDLSERTVVERLELLERRIEALEKSELDKQTAIQNAKPET